MRAALIVVAAVLIPGCSKPEPPAPPAKNARELFVRALDKATFPPELEPFRPAIESAKLDFIRIRAERKHGTSPWASKFRGMPYRPKGESWPTGPDGKPLTLLAQINFADAPPLAGYPRQGILQFFIGGEGRGRYSHIYGMYLYEQKPYSQEEYFRTLQQQDFFRVVYHPAPVTDASKLETTAPRLPDQVLPIQEEAQLSFSPATDYVSIVDYRFERVLGKEPYTFFAEFADQQHLLADRYARFSLDDSLAKIGGYTAVVQEDPRRIRPGEDWLLLLEIRSGEEGGVDVLWGDAGTGVFFIRRADLDKLDFSRVAYYWDNH